MKKARVLVDGGERERGKKSGGKEGRGERQEKGNTRQCEKRITRGAVNHDEPFGWREVG